jgi:CPA1 family monovalent cation:H+ antiporter
MLDIVAILLVLAAVFAFINHRYIKLPSTIGVMALALVLSLALAVLSGLGFGDLHADMEELLKSIDFTAVVDAGNAFAAPFRGRAATSTSASFGRTCGRSGCWRCSAPSPPRSSSATARGTCSRSPARRAAASVLPGIRRAHLADRSRGRSRRPEIGSRAGKPRSPHRREALFNDGVAIVLFILLAQMALSGQEPSVGGALVLFAIEGLGGDRLRARRGQRRVLHDQAHQPVRDRGVLITLAAVVGGYALASRIHVSGPIAAVVIGLVIGNQARALAMSKKSRDRLDVFWDLIDEILNLLLFLLMGAAGRDHRLSEGMGRLPRRSSSPSRSSRESSSWGRRCHCSAAGSRMPAGAARILIWAGLRGGVSVALALSLPRGAEADIIVMLTYSVVVFSIFVQGLTVGLVARAAGVTSPK